jgi:hypothetical protein
MHERSTGGAQALAQLGIRGQPPDRTGRCRRVGRRDRVAGLTFDDGLGHAPLIAHHHRLSTSRSFRRRDPETFHAVAGRLTQHDGEVASVQGVDLLLVARPGDPADLTVQPIRGGERPQLRLVLLVPCSVHVAQHHVADRWRTLPA